MASLSPAERVGIASQCGSLEVGKQADLVVLSKSLKVKSTWIAGEEPATH
jgi:N-acetylglucosamine-6-phosphate deacetylase